MSEIFISYSRANVDEARELCHALREAEWDVWWDEDLMGGEEFDKVIEKQIDEARAVIVVWSKTSVQSGYVKDEAQQAHQLKKLIPVSFEKGVKPPFGLGTIHVQDLSDWDRTQEYPGFKDLLDSIRAVSKGQYDKMAADVFRMVSRGQTTGEVSRIQLISRIVSGFVSEIGGMKSSSLILGSLALSSIITVFSAAGAMTHNFEQAAFLLLFGIPTLSLLIGFVRLIHQFSAIVSSNTYSRKFLGGGFAFVLAASTLLSVTFGFLFFYANQGSFNLLYSLLVVGGIGTVAIALLIGFFRLVGSGLLLLSKRI